MLMRIRKYARVRDSSGILPFWIDDILHRNKPIESRFKAPIRNPKAAYPKWEIERKARPEAIQQMD